MPPLPKLDTVRMPFDIHGTIAGVSEISRCGLHTLAPRHLVHQWFLNGEAEPATTSFKSLQGYTAMPEEEASLREMISLAPSIAYSLAPDAKVTLVFPRNDQWFATVSRTRDRLRPVPTTCNAKHEFGIIPPATHRRYKSVGCRVPGRACPHRALRGAVRFARALNKRVHLVGFEALPKRHGGVDEWVDSHLSFWPRARDKVERYGSLKALGSDNTPWFTRETYPSFAVSQAGHEALSPMNRLLVQATLMICRTF
jgi:hypothetical protein